MLRDRTLQNTTYVPHLLIRLQLAYYTTEYIYQPQAGNLFNVYGTVGSLIWTEIATRCLSLVWDLIY